jgi:hypothetical protein
MKWSGAERNPGCSNLRDQAYWKPNHPREEPDKFTLTDLLRFARVL